VSFLGAADRALMSIERLLEDTNYRPAYTSPSVHDDHADWIQAHRAYYER
jgi:hypothetical protein